MKFVYAPGYDNDFFTAPTQQILLAGNHSHVPVIVGDCDDEGTLFSLTQTNITTDPDFLSYLKQGKETVQRENSVTFRAVLPIIFFYLSSFSPHLPFFKYPLTFKLSFPYRLLVYLPTATDEDIATLAAAYPNDPTVGSPYNTGTLNQLYGQFKRVSSIQGDISFQSTRRVFLGVMASVVPAWSFLYSRNVR